MTSDEPRGPRVLLWAVLAALLLLAGLQPLITFWIVDHVTSDSRGAVVRLEYLLAEQQERVDQLEASLQRAADRMTALEAAPRSERMRWRSEAEQESPGERKAHTWDGIREESSGRYVIELTTMDFALQRLDLLSREARLVPNYSGGKPRGFKLFGIRRDGLLDLLGLRNGDLLTRVNDLPLTSPEGAMEIYTQLADEETFTVAIERGGLPQTLEYRIE